MLRRTKMTEVDKRRRSALLRERADCADRSEAQAQQPKPAAPKVADLATLRKEMATSVRKSSIQALLSANGGPLGGSGLGGIEEAVAL